MFIQPAVNDILCGKSKECIHHPGSKNFRSIIESYSAKYQQAMTKFEKMTITREIYEMIIEKSRFLKLNEETQTWEEISSESARDKIGHSLRFSGRANKRKAKTTKGHRRTHSSSSESSNGTDSTCSSGYSQDSVLGLFQQAQYFDVTPLQPQSSSAPFPSLNGFLEDSENCSSFEFENESIDYLLHLLEEDEPLEDDPLNEVMIADIVKVVQHLDFSSEPLQERELPVSVDEDISYLLSDPVGDF